MTQAERIFAANFPELYASRKVRFPAPGQAEVPRGKLTAPIGPSAPAPLPPKKPHNRPTPDYLRRQRELRLQREKDHLCVLCGAPAKFYPSRTFNKWGKRCPFHAEQGANHAKKAEIKKALISAPKAPVSAP